MHSWKRLVPIWLASRLWWIPFAIRQVFTTRTFHVTSTDYNEYFGCKDQGWSRDAINPFQRHRADFVLKFLRDGDSLLDVSCGNGTTLKYLLARRSIDASGTEFAGAALKHLRDVGLPVIFHDVTHLEEIAGLPEADYITLFEILEHMANPEDYLMRILSKARKGVFFSIPNTGYFPYRLRLMLGSFPVQWIVHPGEHLRFWTYRDLKWWLAQLGLQRNSTVDLYQGVPILNRLWGPLFAMAMVVFVEIRQPSQDKAL